MLVKCQSVSEWCAYGTVMRCSGLFALCLYVSILFAGVQMKGPKFLSKGQTFRVVAGDSLLLPCVLEDLGTYVVLWRRSGQILTAGPLKVARDSRMVLEEGYNLRILNVTSQDAGEFVCQVGDDVNHKQVHNVQVLLPPTVQSSVPKGHVTSRRGSSVTLTCTASGNPMPNILWTKKDSPSLYKEGFSITLEKVERHHAGVYQCSASNGVGPPVSVDLRLDVLHPPEVEVERTWMFSAEGAKVQLLCKVHGLPVPKVTWFQGSSEVIDKERFTSGMVPGFQGSSPTRHWLNIDNVQTSDFANYTCSASNNLGKASGTIYLQGKPGRCARVSSPYSHSPHSYNLTWTVDSFSPLEEVRLIFRQILINDSLHEMGQWVEETFPMDTGNSSVLTHRLWYNIVDLEESSVFQAQVQVKNRYGWGDLSDVYQFYTRGPDEDVAEHNMELLASSVVTSHLSLIIILGVLSCQVMLHL